VTLLVPNPSRRPRACCARCSKAPELVSVTVALDASIAAQALRSDQVVQLSFMRRTELNYLERFQREPVRSFQWQHLQGQELIAVIAADAIDIWQALDVGGLEPAAPQLIPLGFALDQPRTSATASAALPDSSRSGASRQKATSLSPWTDRETGWEQVARAAPTSRSSRHGASLAGPSYP
jgi:hypothetical protein